MASCVLTNSAAVLAIGTSYAVNKLLVLDTNAIVAGGPTCGDVIDDLVVYYTENGGAPGTLKAKLWWDSGADYLAVAEVTFTLDAGVTTSTKKVGIVSINKRLPGSTHQTTPGVLYLGLLCGANAIDVGIGGVELRTRDDSTAQR